MSKIPLLGLTLNELNQVVKNVGMPTFSAKQTALDAAVKIRGQLYAVLRAQQRALLRDNFIIRLNVEFQNLARHGRRKGHLIDIAGRGKRRHEQRFTGKHSAERLAEAAL